MTKKPVAILGVPVETGVGIMPLVHVQEGPGVRPVLVFFDGKHRPYGNIDLLVSGEDDIECGLFAIDQEVPAAPQIFYIGQEYVDRLLQQMPKLEEILPFSARWGRYTHCEDEAAIAALRKLLLNEIFSEWPSLYLEKKEIGDVLIAIDPKSKVAWAVYWKERTETSDDMVHVAMQEAADNLGIQDMDLLEEMLELEWSRLRQDMLQEDREELVT